jgi:hypothetical protein
MAIKVTLGTGQSITRSSAVSVKSQVTQSTATSFSQLQDIDITGAANNSVLVFNNQTNKYEVKPLPSGAVSEATIEEVLSQGNVNMDGGSF